MASEQEVEKKLGMSLDELIASQAKKRATAKPKPKTPQAKKKGGSAQKVQTKGGGRVLVVPRPKGVPSPKSSARSGAALKSTRVGGVQKGGSAPKFAPYGGGGGGAAPRQGGGARNVKVTIGNKSSGRAPLHIPTSGVLSKPFMGGAAARGASGRAPMVAEGPGAPPAGASLAARFDSLTGMAQAGPRPTGAPRRNAHGVLIP